MREMYDVEPDQYIVMDCPCFGVYNNDEELVGLSKHWVKEHGEA